MQSGNLGEWLCLLPAKWNFLSVKDWCVLPLPSMSLTFTLNTTRPSVYGPQLGNGPVTSQPFWIQACNSRSYSPWSRLGAGYSESLFFKDTGGWMHFGKKRNPSSQCAPHLWVSWIRNIYRSCGHPGVKHTLYFVKLVSPEVSKAAVREVVRKCEESQSIDPAQVSWKAGRLDVCENWRRIGMDVTHLGGRHYLTLIDCGPSWFAIWRPLSCQDGVSIVQQLETVFCERGAPVELLTDNATTFSGETFSRFAERWGVRMRFRCAYVPADNGIVERSHRTIKCIAARTRCSVMEAVYWYNVTPKDDASASTAPANIIYSYTARIRGVDVTLPPEDAGPSSYQVGDSVWVKIHQGRCTTQFGKGTITGV